MGRQKPAKDLERTWRDVQLSELERPLSGKIYRCCKPEHATDAKLLSGEGAYAHGGRWMPKGCFHVVYASFTADTARAEVVKPSERDIERAYRERVSLVIRGLEFQVRRSVDLTDHRVLASLSITLDDLLQPQIRVKVGREFKYDGVPVRLGLFVARAGVECLVVPSAEDPKGKNLVLFIDNFQAGSYVRAADGGLPEKLRV